MEVLVKIIVVFLTFTGILLLLATILGLPVMWLWNYVCPYMFGLHEIDFWHAVGLNILCGMLFQNKSVSTKGK